MPRLTAVATQTLDRVVEYFALDPRGLYPPHYRRMPVEIANKGRGDLALLFKDLGLTTGVEVGVEEGHYSEILCRRNPGVHLYCVDPWQAYAGYREHIDQVKLDGFHDAVVERMRPFGATIVRKFSVEAAKDFSDGSLDFVYIDAAHDFFSVVDDLRAWLPKVRSGGCISGHDYARRTDQHGTQRYTVHVSEVIDAYTAATHQRPWFILGRKAVLDGETRDRPRSWFWVVS